MGNITEKLNYLNQTKQEIKQALIAKGATVNDTDTFRSYAEKISTIETGIDTSDGTAVSSDILEGKVAYSQDQRIVGTLKMESDYNAKIDKFTNQNGIGTAITEIGKIDMSNVTDASYIFSNCLNLKTISKLITGNITKTYQMFNNCKVLISVPSIEMSKVTDASSMFANCYLLETLPPMTLTNTTNVSLMFNYCKALKEVTLYNTNKIQNASGMFSYCLALETINELDFSSATRMVNMFSGCSALVNLGGFKNLGKAFATASANNSSYKLDLSMATNLTHDSLMNVINGLYTITNTQQLVLGATNKGKLTSDEIAIATSKGWTVS